MKFKKITAVFIVFFIINYGISQSLTISNWAKISYDKIVQDKMMPPSLKKVEDFTENITREEFTELIMSYLIATRNYRIERAISKFSDTKNPYVVTAAKLNIVSGTGKDKFSPHKSITREEAALIVYNAEKLNFDMPDGDLEKYNDRYFISKWARQSVASLTKKGIFSGDGSGNFRPKGSITKEEALAIVDKLITANQQYSREIKIFKDGDAYLSKSDYEFLFENMPDMRFSMQEMINSINSTDRKKRQEYYEKMLNTHINSTSVIKSSPNLFFKYDKSYYFLGLEIKKNTREQRTFCFRFNIYENSDLLSIDEKNYGSWYNI